MLSDFSLHSVTRDFLLTWVRVERLRYPVGVREILDIVVIHLVDEARWCTRFVLKLFALDERRNYALDGVWPCSQVLSDGFGHLVQQDALRVEDAQTLDGRDVLAEDIPRLGTRMEKPLLVPAE